MIGACGKTVDESVVVDMMKKDFKWSVAQVVQKIDVLPWPWGDYICSRKYDVRFYVNGVNASGERDAATVCCRSGEPCAVYY
ncbi:hypothetical protein A2318_02570 [Candidatus Uhrbacteria bacterium RIFOXYB2_FULL_45_11]|uniref:Uncharacterized protein n=1 Tax=Candidatus Uhrbacteria bacterium RIFOXYB2_FULL_45_11 TaxID=1802421 RepID=A0A1F7WAC5_9BACT|nr:MAG: hypothetical protein A2318_02570 [Candidatus Uhrbacteria bacterium RIFOXYB2_FULL_45_11]